MTPEEIQRAIDLRNEAIRRLESALAHYHALGCPRCGCYVVWVNHYRRGWLCTRCRHFEAVRLNCRERKGIRS